MKLLQSPVTSANTERKARDSRDERAILEKHERICAKDAEYYRNEAGPGVQILAAGILRDGKAERAEELQAAMRWISKAEGQNRCPAIDS